MPEQYQLFLHVREGEAMLLVLKELLESSRDPECRDVSLNEFEEECVEKMIEVLAVPAQH